MKICTKCREEKPFSEFSKNCRAKDGHQHECKSCNSEYCTSESRKAYRRKYKQSKEYKISQSKYMQSEAGKLSAALSNKKYKLKNKEKITAHRRVQVAVGKGVLIKEPCEVCGSDNAEGHHDDYRKPLEVRWLCRPHHAEYHRQKGYGED